MKKENSKLCVFKNTKVYVYAPSNFATGGPEDLHQLAYKLRTYLGVDAYMYYDPPTAPNPVHEAYRNYNIPYVRAIDDSENNILVVPETASIHKALKCYPNIRKVFWWLSVDNHYVTLPPPRGRINAFILFKLNLQGHFWGSSKVRRPEIIHFAQSEYAVDHLKKKGLNPIYLSDFLNKGFLESTSQKNNKEDFVAYNPLKGKLFTDKVIKAASGVNFVPIKNMSREQVILLLSRAKVYIDFGNHPGKDRIPREAAALNCCVITGRRGSANFKDVDIPNEYKFVDKVSSIPAIVARIQDCISNYRLNIERFDGYRSKVFSEESRFERDLQTIFVKV